MSSTAPKRPTAKERTAKLRDVKRQLASYKYAYGQLDRHGKLHVYFRRAGEKPIRMREELGSIEFKVTHDALMKGQRPPETVRAHVSRPTTRPTVERTLGWLIDKYEHPDNVSYRKLSESTKNARGNIFKLMRATLVPGVGLPFGEMPLSKFTVKWVKYLRDSRLIWKTVDEDGETTEVRTNTESANSWLKALRALFKWAVNESHLDIQTNPTIGVSLFPGNADGFYCWSPEDVAKFRAFYPIGTKERLAMELLIRTLQRRGDIVRLGRHWLTNDSKGRTIFKFKQEKNGRTEKAVTAFVPYFDDLRRTIEATPDVGDVVILQSKRGKPFVKESFTNWFRDVCDRAGLPQCSAHGLRKAGIVELIRHNVPRRQIMAISGHTTEKEFDRYARSYMRQHAMEQMLDDYLLRDAA